MQQAIERLEALNWPGEVTRPNFSADFQALACGTPAGKRLAESLNIRVKDAGQDNTILLSHDFAPLPVPVQISFKGERNICLLEGGIAWRGALSCHSDCVAVLLGGQHVMALNALLYHGGKLFWGRNARTFGCRIWAHGGRRVVVGDDCLFSEGISIRSSDHHSIIDLDTYTQMNVPDDVTIGRHVWIGPDVQILRGVQVGLGSVVGAGSIVTRNIAPKELWAGVPARRLKQNVSWVDSHPANPRHIAALREMLGD